MQLKLSNEHNEDSQQNDSENPQEENSPKLLKFNSLNQPEQSPGFYNYDNESPKTKFRVRVFVFALSVAFLIFGRYNIPDHVSHVCVDKLQDLFLGANKFIMENPFWRSTFQIICSIFMDAMYITTGINWIVRGGGSRLIFTTVTFYLIRAGVQAIWISPFPDSGYWWYDPGLPSLVVPYGEGTDFFFSGHVGFVTICASEWKANGNNTMPKIFAVGGLYTALILLIYKVHYSIDLFVGVTFAHWLFMIVNQNREKIDNFWVGVFYFVKGLFCKKLYNSYREDQLSDQKLYNV